jgi:mRNA interferase MazF
MSVSRGDVILADLPYSDATGSKIRPALVVQNDRNNARLDDVIVALITTTTHRATTEPTQLLIDLKTAEGQRSGLLHNSSVKCEHLITLNQRLVRRVIGQLTADAMLQIDACLRASLGI